MKTIFEHIEYVKAKPHHVRKRVAFVAAASVTAAIGLIWLVGSVSLGLFAIQGSDFAESTGAAAPVETTSAATNTSGLAGVAAAAWSGDNAPAHIEIVDTKPATTTPLKSEQTVLPF